MNPLKLMSSDEQKEIRRNLFASEEFFSGLRTGLARAGVISASRLDINVVENTIHPKVTIEIKQLDNLLRIAKEAMQICQEVAHIPIATCSPMQKQFFGANANSVCSDLRSAIETIEKIIKT